MVRVWTRCRTVALRLRDSRRDVLPPPRAALHLGALRRWCLSQTAQTREALPPYATLQHRASTLIIVEEIVPLNAEKVNGLGCFSRGSPSAARKPGHRPTDRPPAGWGGCGHPPLRRAIEPVRRAGCPHPAKPGRRDHRVFDCCGPAMAACGHAALRGSAGAWRESGAFSGGYIIRPYMHALPFPIVGAHCICAQTAPPVRRRLARKRSCPRAAIQAAPTPWF